VDAILQGAFANCPQGELTAVLYAEHWAETDGAPDRAVREKFVGEYGQEAADDVDIILRTVRAGNYTGNTVDYLLYRLSFGRWGWAAPAARRS
jgi:hypothetical protein